MLEVVHERHDLRAEASTASRIGQAGRRAARRARARARWRETSAVGVEACPGEPGEIAGLEERDDRVQRRASPASGGSVRVASASSLGGLAAGSTVPRRAASARAERLGDDVRPFAGAPGARVRLGGEQRQARALERRERPARAFAASSARRRPPRRPRGRPPRSRAASATTAGSRGDRGCRGCPPGRRGRGERERSPTSVTTARASSAATVLRVGALMTALPAT